VNRSDLIEYKLTPALNECRLHLRRLNYAADLLEGLFPLDKDAWLALDDGNIAAIDQLLFRFGKLQDAMGQRLFSAILMLGADWQEDESFFDKLNRLEKLQVIPSVTEWISLRELRNFATHEYPDAPEQNAANLNQIHSALPALRSALEQASSYAQKHYLG